MKVETGVPMGPMGPSKQEVEAVKKISQQFESLFVNHIVAAMRKTVVKQGIVPESHAERVYQAMLDQEYSAQISKSDQVGLAKIVSDHLLRKNNIR